MATITATHGINTQEILAKQALGLLEDELILGAFVAKSAGAEFNGAKDDTVNVRRPSKLAARELDWRLGEQSNPETAEKNRQIITDVLNESKMPVRLNKHLYSAVDLTDEQLTLNIDDFGGQVTAPQTRAVAERIEMHLHSLMQEAAAPLGYKAELTEAGLRKAVLDARAKLNKYGVPTQSRILLVGSAVEAALLNSPVLTRVDEAGTSAALREATIGRYFGFTVVVSQLIDEKRVIALHPSAFIFVSRSPMTPPSVKSGASLASNGAAVRSIRDYNSNTLSDRQVLSTFAGFSAVMEPIFYTDGEMKKEYHPITNNNPIVTRKPGEWHEDKAKRSGYMRRAIQFDAEEPQEEAQASPKARR
ncbi:P22 phage major capsid protein family protein (plasmid) [Streptomyces sp. BI20]|uniref:P22 phage major capsid protein family protein n=1 Tax=Streptomyces sp. BI20 TaxID=3403460 RepID=UPI003C792206